MTWAIKTSDQFGRADGALPGSTLDNGAGGTETNTWTEIGTAGWLVFGGKAYKSAGPAGTMIIVGSTAATTSHRVNGTCYLPGVQNIGIIAMYDVATGKNYTFYKGSSSSVLLYFDGGAFNTVLGGGPVEVDGDGMTLECTPGVQVCSVNGTPVITGGDTNLTSGVPGMYSEGQAGFDNFTYEVVAGAPVATQLAITTQPAGNQSNVTLPTQPVVAVRDVSNATVTTDASTVTATLTTVSGTGTLGGTTTAVASSGVATFTNLKITGAGSFKIRFTDGSLTLADSGTIYVGATQLAITSVSTPTYSKHPTTVVVTAKDANGVTVANYTGTVAVTVNKLSGAGSVATLTGGTSSAAAVAGVATLTPIATTSDNGLVATSFTYTAAATGLTSATTATITPTVSESIAVTIT